MLILFFIKCHWFVASGKESGPLGQEGTDQILNFSQPVLILISEYLFMYMFPLSC